MERVSHYPKQRLEHNKRALLVLGIQVGDLGKRGRERTREARADAVVGVHHRSDAIEAETVKHELIHVEAEVREEETEDLVRAIVEKPAVDV